ncbi:MAG: UDP-galactopyranose mutase [Caloramator sp.]|nr:UDP-galactopyranose mutase [Caloramator sp.]
MDVVVVGCGFAGAVIARILAEKGMKVLIVEKREHIGGNMYDYKDESGAYIHKYGPHIFHTNSDEVLNFINRFSSFFSYEHQVAGFIDGKFVPIPFNLLSIEMTMDNFKEIKDILIKTFGYGSVVPITVLMKYSDSKIRSIGDYVYEKVFLNYTKKQWGNNKVDETVLNRVPVYISYDRKYFTDKYQIMPCFGYTALFNNMINHPNIKIMLNCDFKECLKLNIKTSKILFHGKTFKGAFIYTGSIDELFEYKYGRLDYRSLRFEFKMLNKKYYQMFSVVNYPNDYDYTRITEFKHFTSLNVDSSKTTILYEYPCPCKESDIPYYPVLSRENNEVYYKYLKEAKRFKNLFLIGRLAEYKYYNMDQVILKSIDTAKKVLEK